MFTGTSFFIGALFLASWWLGSKAKKSRKNKGRKR